MCVSTTLNAQIITSGPPLTLQPKTDLWVVNENTRIGATERVKAQQQDPYPFCFSAAAALLWDQHRCTVDKKKCSEYPQTSFLSVTAAGQGSTDDQLKIREGGNAAQSLAKLVDEGFVSLDRCKHNPTVNVQGHEHILPMMMRNWKRHKDYAPYLERAYKRQFIQSVKNINPEIPEEKSLELLQSDLTGDKLINQLLLSETCFSEVQRDSRFKIKIKNIETPSKSTFDNIDQLLAKKYPVLVAFCLTDTKPIDKCSNRHTAIIIAKAKATHKITGDTRTYYWMINTWGEQWQQKFSDGWIAADQLYSGIFGELIWLEKR